MAKCRECHWEDGRHDAYCSKTGTIPAVQIFGWWSIRDDQGIEVHRVEGHHPVTSTAHEKAELGLLRRVDLDRFGVEWVDA